MATAKMLEDGAANLVNGCEHEIFTSVYFILARKIWKLRIYFYIMF